MSNALTFRSSDSILGQKRRRRVKADIVMSRFDVQRVRRISPVGQLIAGLDQEPEDASPWSLQALSAARDKLIQPRRSGFM